MNAQENARIVREIYAAFGRDDLDRLLEKMAPDVEWYSPGAAPYSGERRGREQIRDFFRVLSESVEIERFDTGEFLAQGEKVVVLGEERFRVRRTGERVEQDWAHVYTVRDGQVVRVQLFEDTAAQQAVFGQTTAEQRATLGPMGVTEPPFSGDSGPEV